MEGDLPRDELARVAEEAFTTHPMVLAARATPDQVAIYFKASCPRCGERCMFEEPNSMFETMECCLCGLDFPFIEGGFLLQITKSPKLRIVDDGND